MDCRIGHGVAAADVYTKAAVVRAKVPAQYL
jgi:hypothetical protein